MPSGSSPGGLELRVGVRRAAVPPARGRGDLQLCCTWARRAPALTGFPGHPLSSSGSFCPGQSPRPGIQVARPRELASSLGAWANGVPEAGQDRQGGSWSLVGVRERF